MSDCCEHMLYHWVMMPYQCRHCPNEFYTAYDLKHHLKIEHPDLGMYLDPTGPTLEKAVQRIENIKKRPIAESASDSPAKKKPKAEDTKKSKKPETEVQVIKSGVVINKWKQLPNKTPASLGTSDIAVINIDDDDEDLVVVSKTDDDVPDEDKVFACDACAFIADTETSVTKHLLDVHGIKGVKFHLLSKKKAENPSLQDMACNICNEVFPELKLRRHFLDNHLEGHLFCPYRFKCDICSQRYLTLQKVKMHFKRFHPGAALQYEIMIQSTDLQSPPKSKLYSCTFCSYSNISTYTAPIRSHVRRHLKPVKCNHCSALFKYQSEIQTHNNKEHPELEISYSMLTEVQEEFVKTLQEISIKAVPVSDSGVIRKPKSASTARLRNVAKKSTSVPFMSPKSHSDKEAEYSYYGIPAEDCDLSNIRTTFELDGLEYTTTAKQMMKMFNMDTFVDVSDCAVDALPLDKS